MFLAVGEGEETGVLHFPRVKAPHDGFHQLLANAPSPEVRANCQRTKEPHTAPSGGKVRTHKLTANLRSKAELGSASQRVPR